MALIESGMARVLTVLKTTATTNAVVKHSKMNTGNPTLAGLFRPEFHFVGLVDGQVQGHADDSSEDLSHTVRNGLLSLPRQ